MSNGLVQKRSISFQALSQMFRKGTGPKARKIQRYTSLHPDLTWILMGLLGKVEG